VEFIKGGIKRRIYKRGNERGEFIKGGNRGDLTKTEVNKEAPEGAHYILSLICLLSQTEEVK